MTIEYPRGTRRTTHHLAITVDFAARYEHHTRLGVIGAEISVLDSRASELGESDYHEVIP